jgi:hypothetical protein
MTYQVSRPSSLTSNVEGDLEWVEIVVDCDIDTDIASLKSLISKEDVKTLFLKTNLDSPKTNCF